MIDCNDESAMELIMGHHYYFGGADDGFVSSRRRYEEIHPFITREEDFGSSARDCFSSVNCIMG